MKDWDVKEGQGDAQEMIQIAATGNGSEHGDSYESHGSNPLLTLDPGMAIWTWLVFFMLLGVLTRFGWKPILRALREREEKIERALQESERLEKSNQEADKKAQALLDSADSEAEAIVEKSKMSAKQLGEKLTNEAKTEAEKILAAARSQIEQERKAAKENLRKEVVTMSIEIAGKLVEKNLDETSEQKLIEESLKNFK